MFWVTLCFSTANIVCKQYLKNMLLKNISIKVIYMNCAEANCNQLAKKLVLNSE